LNESLAALKEEIAKKTKMLRLLIAFMGINEEVVQIADGEQAPETEPLALYQQLLYMDEEVGIWKGGGLDFKTLDEFDKWIVQNINMFLYRPRSVVAWQVRRRPKEYCDNWFENTLMNQYNFVSYLLIRNGQQIYRIWSDVQIPGRLFPTKSEYEEILVGDFGSDQYKQKELQQRHETYMFGLVALQGLIERTEILGPGLRGQVNLIKNQLGGKVELIRDAEPDHFISDGHPRWCDFLKANQETIEVGSRVSLVGDFQPHTDDNGQWRTEPFHPNRLPDPTEICIVAEPIEGGHGSGTWGNFKTFYDPKDEIWGWQPKRDDDGDYWQRWRSHPRKRRVPFRFYREEAINIDTITSADCEYYERSRLDRADYLNLLRTIHFIKIIKQDEERLEAEFVKLVANRLGLGDNQLSFIRKQVDWWKLKNKWKRGLMADDAKALRMIERKCRSELKKIQ
jgi:hypothetical protein